MLNGSLVCYSDSEGSEGQDGGPVRKELTRAMNARRQQASHDNSEKHLESKLSPQRPLLANIVYSPPDGDEVFVNDPETKTPSPGMVSRCKIAVTPLCIDLSSIPLPGESPVEGTCKSKPGSGSKKKPKHSSKALYLPPALRTDSPSQDFGCGNQKDTCKEVDVDTPKRKKSPRTGETRSKRKGAPLFEDLIQREEVVSTKMVKTEEDFSPNSSCNQGESRRFSEPKKVTLRPFWLACPPPRRPFMTSLCASEVHGSVRSEYTCISTSSQHLSLPFDGASLNNSPDSGVVEPNGHSSLPDLSSSCAEASAETPSPRLCSLGDNGCSTAESSPNLTQSTGNADLHITQAESESRYAVQRRHSHESSGRSMSRSRLNSLPPRLRKRVVEISYTNMSCSHQSSSWESLSRSPLKGWTSNFQKKYFGFSDEYIDTHCHLDFLYRRQGFKGSFQKYKVLHKDTFPGNFAGCVAVFCEPQSFKPKGGLWKSITLEPDVWVAMGCHPKCVEDYTSWTEEALTACLRFPKVIAAGEFGLDYSGRFRMTADRQKDVFVRQLKIASAQDKPLVIHCRRAEDDTFLIMKQYASKHVPIHRHCFSLDYEEACRWFDAFPNLYVGLTPLVTYGSAVETHDLARKVPLDRLLLETDSPYFVPRDVPRGEMSFSHPGMAITVAHEVASFQGIPVSKVLQATRKNTKDMYGI